MYALRRLAYLPFSLWLLSLVCFGLHSLAAGDPVADQLPPSLTATGDDPGAYDRAYNRMARKMGYDRPPFYVSIRNAALPDTLYRILQPSLRRTLAAVATRYGNWEGTVAFYEASLRLSDPAQVAIVRRMWASESEEAIREYVMITRHLRATTNSIMNTV